MARNRRSWIYAVALAVWCTGAVWLWFHYFVKSVDSLGFEVPHPVEKWSLIAHALVSSYAIWWFGTLWNDHIKAGWKAGVQRWSGGTLVGFVSWLAMTGYPLYYIVNDTWRDRVSLLHWTMGLGAVAAFLLHLPRVTARHRRKRSQ